MSTAMTYEQYFTPDPSLRDPRPESDMLPEMLPSLSSRTISLHSAISVHGWDFFDGRKVWYEAELEQNFALVVAMRPDVVEIAEQPPAVTYFDDHGRKRPHTFDFKLRMMNGTSGLVAVKPFALVEKTGIRRVVELTAEQMPPSVADWTLLFTDLDLSLTDLFNAKVIHHARRDPWPQDDAVVARLIRNLKGEISIGELAARSGLGGYAFEAVVRAIADGKLKPVEYGMLDDNLAVVAAKRKRKA
ncbi:hypothetical protein ACVWWI_004350 [Bradyrhizobium sp. USDA 3686]|uniref:hypothetical protein n=1 Tax=Bradyrhizobium canariense TaxID=255045 RepID=UPI00195B5134|nr:hypothetical protein [Bradyrhizobium canariense]MBM7482339.1 hypothetical protein [Bradyrhizobium canariense]